MQPFADPLRGGDLVGFQATLNVCFGSFLPVGSATTSEHRPEPVPPQPDSVVADVDAAFKRPILDISQRERVADMNHSDQADYIVGGAELPNRGVGLSLAARFDGPSLDPRPPVLLSGQCPER